MSISFSFATIKDLPEIVRIYNQTIPTRQSTADLEPVTVSDREEWFKSHNQHHRPLWLIKSDNQVFGWISLADFYHLGVKALEFVESNVKNFGIETILAYIFGHNAPSQGLFKKFSYVQWAHLPEVAEMDGVKRDLDILGKKY